MKKTGIAILVFALCLFVLSGCGKEDNAPTQTQPGSSAPTVESETPYNGQSPSSPTNNNATDSAGSTEGSMGEDLKDDISKGIEDASDALDNATNPSNGTR